MIESAKTRKLPSRPYVLRLIAFFFVSFVIVLYLAFSPMVNRDFYNIRVLFKPVKCSEYKLDWSKRTAKEIRFTNKNGTRLCGLYFPIPDATHVVLVHHGQYGNLNNHLEYCSYLLQPENSLFIYDYAGFGKSEGTPTIGGIIDDSRAAYDCLIEQLKIDPNTIVNYGGSLGSGPAALVAAEKPCAGLLLFSPYTSLKAEAREIFPFFNLYPDFLLTDSDFDTLANVQRLKAPVLIAHGTNDSCIAVHHSDQVYAAAHEPKTYLRVNAGEHSVTDSTEVKAKVLAFIRELGARNFQGR